MNENRYLLRPLYPMGKVDDLGDEVGADEDGPGEEEKEKEDSEGLECSPCGPGGDKEEENDEARKPRVPRRPLAPTKQEIEEHEVTHLPPRDWCPHCVAGHGISNQHRISQDKDEKAIGITVGLDYCFMREGEREDEDNF